MRLLATLAFPAGLISLTVSLGLAFALLTFAGAADWVCDRLEARADQGGR